MAFLRLFIAFWIMLASAVAAGDDGFTSARAGYQFQFPRDHGSHPDFRIEWWYFTGNLTDEAGNPWGYKMTIFRAAQAAPDRAPASPLAATQIFLCHFAISSIANRDHEAWEDIGREGFGQAHASTERMDIALKDYRILMDDEGVIHVSAKRDHAAMELRMRPLKPFVIHGVDGVHQKADLEDQGSHYIAFTRLETEGTITWRGGTHKVRGLGWMDHEFGSDFLAPSQAGWDWFAIQLDSGEDIMVYQIRNRDGSANPYSIGSIVEADGTLVPIRSDRFSIQETGRWKSPRSGGDYPMGWVLRFPDDQGELIIDPTFPEQEMTMREYTNTSYWEGAIRVRGTWRGAAANGKGYVELVGYAGDFDLL